MINRACMAVVLTVLLVTVMPIRATEDLRIERLATCQDSWLEWKDDPVQTKRFADAFQAAFLRKPDDQFFIPRSRTTVAGLPVLQAFPESVGMAVGFSVLVDADFDNTKKSLEQMLGKPLRKCETGDNMRACELQLGEKKTVVLMAEDNPKSKTTLVGCYYYYEK
jgi:hypothetical protein